MVRVANKLRSNTTLLSAFSELYEQSNEKVRACINMVVASFRNVPIKQEVSLTAKCFEL